MNEAMKTLEIKERTWVKSTRETPRRNQPNEIPQPGKDPDADPAKEPELDMWPRKNPETPPGREPLTAPPSSLPEVPDLSESIHLEGDSDKKQSGKQIRAQYKACLNEILDCFSEQDNTATSAIHELRVDLKRADALIRLIQDSSRKIPSRRLKTFRSFFRLAGKLRSAQVEFDLISEYFSEPSFNPTYLHQLHENKARWTKKYRAFFKKSTYSSLEKTIRLLKQSAKELTRKQIRQYLEAEEERITKRLKRTIFREQDLHNTRKELKRYYLNLTMAKQHNQPVKKLLELLGLWHDLQVAFDHLVKAIHTAGLTEPETEPIQKIKNILITEKENLYENIVTYYLTDVNARENDSPVLMSQYS
jgi:CHAD domain-containing protein